MSHTKPTEEERDRSTTNGHLQHEKQLSYYILLKNTYIFCQKEYMIHKNLFIKKISDNQSKISMKLFQFLLYERLYSAKLNSELF